MIGWTYYGRRHRGHLYRGGFLLQTPHSFISIFVSGEADGTSAAGDGSLSSPAGAIGTLDGSDVWVSRSWIDMLVRDSRRAIGIVLVE